MKQDSLTNPEGPLFQWASFKKQRERVRCIAAGFHCRSMWSVTFSMERHSEFFQSTIKKKKASLKHSQFPRLQPLSMCSNVQSHDIAQGSFHSHKWMGLLVCSTCTARNSLTAEWLSSARQVYLYHHHHPQYLYIATVLRQEVHKVFKENIKSIEANWSPDFSACFRCKSSLGDHICTTFSENYRFCNLLQYNLGWTLVQLLNRHICWMSIRFPFRLAECRQLGFPFWAWYSGNLHLSSLGPWKKAEQHIWRVPISCLLKIVVLLDSARRAIDPLHPSRAPSCRCC